MNLPEAKNRFLPLAIHCNKTDSSLTFAPALKIKRSLIMKNIWTIFAVLLVFAFTPLTAEAKRFGGGKSFGSTRQTAPAQPAARPDAATPAQGSAAAANAGKKGMMGGLLGGLLAGGLIGALLGGAFEGIQFMDILIIGLLAFVIFRLLRRRAPVAQQHAYPGPGIPKADQRSPFDAMPPARDTVFGNAGNSSSGFTASSIPFNLPPGFNMNGFLAGAREHYRTLQDAWNKNDLVKIQEYVSPELYNDLRTERATLDGDQHTEVLFVDAELVRADHNASSAEVSIKFTGRYRDTHEGVEEPLTDIWHLQRDLTRPDAPWYIIGIES